MPKEAKNQKQSQRRNEETGVSNAKRKRPNAYVQKKMWTTAVVMDSDGTHAIAVSALKAKSMRETVRLTALPIALWTRLVLVWFMQHC